jgi:hypothetical protein
MGLSSASRTSVLAGFAEGLAGVAAVYTFGSASPRRARTVTPGRVTRTSIR